MIMAPPLTYCLRCEHRIEFSPSDVFRITTVHEGKRFYYECQRCGLRGNVFLDWLMLERKVNEIEADRQEVETEDFKREARQKQGVLVKGFAIDLEPVETVEDIKLYWDVQESSDPASIPREGKHGR